MSTLTKKDLGRLYYILMPKSTGKSRLCKNMNTCRNDKDKLHICIDLDEYTNVMLADPTFAKKANILKTNANLSDTVLFPFVKSELVKLLKDYKSYNMLLFSSSRTLIPFLNINPKQLYVYIPSPKLWTDTILTNIKSNDTQQILEQSKHDILAEYGPHSTTYDTFDELEDDIISVFKLTKRTSPTTKKNINRQSLSLGKAK